MRSVGVVVDRPPKETRGGVHSRIIVPSVQQLKNDAVCPTESRLGRVFAAAAGLALVFNVTLP